MFLRCCSQACSPDEAYSCEVPFQAQAASRAAIENLAMYKAPKSSIAFSAQDKIHSDMGNARVYTCRGPAGNPIEMQGYVNPQGAIPLAEPNVLHHFQENVRRLNDAVHRLERHR
jgi:hypothetical protein